MEKVFLGGFGRDRYNGGNRLKHNGGKGASLEKQCLSQRERHGGDLSDAAADDYCRSGPRRCNQVDNLEAFCVKGSDLWIVRKRKIGARPRSRDVASKGRARCTGGRVFSRFGAVGKRRYAALRGGAGQLRVAKGSRKKSKTLVFVCAASMTALVAERHAQSPLTHLRFLCLTPGLSSLRNSMPAFSSTVTTLPRVSVRAPTGPSKFSIRRMVPRATRDFRDSSPCDQLSRARAARKWEPVRLIKLRRYHVATCKPK